MEYPAHLSRRRTGVSILVFVELALDVKLVLGTEGGKAVSILVFVELALDGPAEAQSPCQT